MDKGILLVTIIFLAIIILPFVFIGLSKKKKRNRFLNKITNLADLRGCTITRHEISNNFIIGIDDSAGCLFFYKKEPDKEILRDFNLKEFKTCKLLNVSRTVNDKQNQLQLVQKLELCFYPIEEDQPEEVIEFYNDEYDSLTLSGELQMIERWEDQINKYLKTLHKEKPAVVPVVKASTSGKNKKKFQKSYK